MELMIYRKHKSQWMLIREVSLAEKAVILRYAMQLYDIYCTALYYTIRHYTISAPKWHVYGSGTFGAFWCAGGEAWRASRHSCRRPF